MRGVEVTSVFRRSKFNGRAISGDGRELIKGFNLAVAPVRASIL